MGTRHCSSLWKKQQKQQRNMNSRAQTSTRGVLNSSKYTILEGPPQLSKLYTVDYNSDTVQPAVVEGHLYNKDTSMIRTAILCPKVSMMDRCDCTGMYSGSLGVW